MRVEIANLEDFYNKFEGLTNEFKTTFEQKIIKFITFIKKESWISDVKFESESERRKKREGNESR